MFRRSFSSFRRVADRWKVIEKEFKLTEVAKDVLQVLTIYHITTFYFVDGTLCVGPSMLPTFNETGDFVLIDRWTHSYYGGRKRYQNQDVVIAISPYDPKKTICKRVSATEGETVEVEWAGGLTRRLVVPAGHVWLTGDNASNSLGIISATL